jgi:hypothetical protein
MLNECLHSFGQLRYHAVIPFKIIQFSFYIIILILLFLFALGEDKARPLNTLKLKRWAILRK